MSFINEHLIIPEGFKLVPVCLTPNMIFMARMYLKTLGGQTMGDAYNRATSEDTIAEMYKLMLSVAPKEG